MFRGKHGPLLVSALLGMVLFTTLVGASSAGADSFVPRSAADRKLAEKQKAVLDPQTVKSPEASTSAGKKAAAQRSTQQRTAAAAQASTSALASSTGGRWASAQSLPTGFNPIHVVVGPGKVLLVAGSGNDAANFAAGTFRSYVCSARMDNCRQVPTPVDMFCAGHVLLPDGRALVGGGTLSYGAWKGAKYMYAFNFATESYNQLSPLEIGRWYPSMITVINGQTLITGGFDHNGALTGTTELFDYQTNTHRMLAGSHKFPLYPHIRLTVKLNYFFDGAGYGTTSGYAPGFWDPVKNTFKSVSGLRSPSQRSSAASCFVGDMRNQNLLVMGGGHPAISTTDKIRLSDTSPKFVPGPSLKAKKMYLNCLSLPDGKLLEVGGGTGNYLANASYEVSTLSSIGSTSWTSMNPIPAGNDRLYHSSAFVLDDGRVVSIGSDPTDGSPSTSVQMFSPPYLYKGTRPAITKIQCTIDRYSTIPVSTTGGATRLTITKAPSPTHGSEPNAGYMSFPISSGKVNLSQGLARYLPRGFYRVWAVNAAGAVSTAKWVYIRDAGQTLPSMGCCC
jgi:hypothetical protein